MSAVMEAAALVPWRLHRRGAADWPERLEHLAQPPEQLWFLGSAPLETRSVAVVGSRSPSITGLEVAGWLAGELAHAGIQVVSGFALGIDGAAHRGALAGGGTTVAVLGCGIDVCYPRRHAALRSAVISRGLLVTEEEPGTPPEHWRFPKRNRLIAALSAAVVVVEASARSGALSTARHAADLGREVLAVPGSIRNPTAVGTNLLIRDGATPLLGVEDVFQAVPALAEAASQTHRTGRQEHDYPPDEVLRLLGTDPVHPDAVALELGLPAQAVAARLTTLEVAGLIASLPGGRVVRLPRRPSGPGPQPGRRPEDPLL